MKLDIYQVDAFSDRSFSGNPAAVCPLKEWLPDTVLQNIATENNLSETAYFVSGNGHYELRWFTPQVEVDLCGHATLAAAHVLFEHLKHKGDSISFRTKSGELSVKKETPYLTMDFPANPVSKVELPAGLEAAMNVNALECYKGMDYLLILDSEESVRSVAPDFFELKKVGTRGVIVTAPGSEVDFVSRFFGPAVGIDEDPVTGSAHTELTPYWSERLGKKELIARQISKRGGELKCKLNDNRVEISGSAFTYLTGTIQISS